MMEEETFDQVDSDFESGNICRAYDLQDESRDFYLLTENDINTHGYNNWFFFRFRNGLAGTVRFNIANLAKKTFYFSQGMLISIFSMKRHNRDGTKWFKGGNKITFGQVNFLRSHHSNDYYSCLSWEYTFEEGHDEVYFALNQPYTYSRAIQFLESLEERLPEGISMEIKNIGFTLSNNLIPLLRLGSKEEEDEGIRREEKKVILVLARQHPCETVGSFVAEGIITHLLSNSETSRFLLSKF